MAKKKTVTLTWTTITEYTATLTVAKGHTVEEVQRALEEGSASIEDEWEGPIHNGVTIIAWFKVDERAEGGGEDFQIEP